MHGVKLYFIFFYFIYKTSHCLWKCLWATL